MTLDRTTVAIAALALLEAVALYTGTDGAYFLPVVAVIAGLAGYMVPAPGQKRR